MMDGNQHMSGQFRTSELIDSTWHPRPERFQSAEAASAWADATGLGPAVKIEQLKDGIWTSAVDVQGEEKDPDKSRLAIFAAMANFRAILRSRSLTPAEAERLATLLEWFEDFYREVTSDDAG